MILEQLFTGDFLLTMMTTWLLLGIFVAVVTGTFKTIREKQKADDIADNLKKEEIELEFLQRHGYIQHHLFESDEEHHQHEVKLKQILQDRSRQKRAVYGGSNAKKTVGKGKAVGMADQTWVEEFHPDTNQHHESPQYMDELVTAYAQKVLNHDWFPHAGSIVILAHTFAMTCDQYDTTEFWKKYAEVSYIVCNCLFSAELILRTAAVTSVNNFFEAKINIAEMLLVSFGVIGLIFDLRFFVLMPALRLYRLMRYLPTLQHLLELAIGSMKPISNLLVFMLVCSLAVAVTGRYVFADKMNSSRSNFGTFPEAMITVFQVSAKITSIIMAQ